MILVLPDVTDTSIKPEIQYTKLSKEGLSFGNSPSSLAIESYKLQEILKVCTEGTLCGPKEYVSYYEKTPKKKFDLAALKQSVTLGLEYSERGEEYCVIGEFLKNEVCLAVCLIVAYNFKIGFLQKTLLCCRRGLKIFG